MMHETEPPTTRSLLERIAAILHMSPSAFLNAERTASHTTEPTPAERNAVVMLYCSIADPDRRAAIMALLREMAAKS